MKQELELVQEIHIQKAHSMNKILQQWFLNKNNSFSSYARAEQALIKILIQSFEIKKQTLQGILNNLKSTETGNKLARQRNSFKRLLSAVTNKEQSNEGVHFLSRMTNSFQREIMQFAKSIGKEVTMLQNLRKDIFQVIQKQNIHYRTIDNEHIKKPCSLKEVYTMSNLVLREIQKRIKFIRSWKQIVKTILEKQLQVLSSLEQNLKSFVDEFPEYSGQMGLITKYVQSLIQKNKEISVHDIKMIDPIDRTEKQIKSEELSTFLGTSQQQIIWTSNVEGLQTSFLNQMAVRTWRCEAKKQNDYKPHRAIITTDGLFLLVDKYMIVDHELNLRKIIVLQNQSHVVTIQKPKSGLLKIMGNQNICSLRFQSQEQCQQFILHTSKFN